MDILHAVFAAGVVGAGGAGFPTHKKLVRGAELLLVNAAECEPLLASDRLVMRLHADKVVRALVLLQRELAIARVVIGTKSKYTREIAALQSAIEAQGAAITIHGVGSFYPAGDEQVLIYEVTGKTVPPGGIPLALGIVVINVTTAMNIADAVQGRPVTHKYITVNGEVREPCIVQVPVGAPVAECIAAAGGPTCRDYFIVMGGPMMGRQYTPEKLGELFIGKSDGGVLLLPHGNPLPFYTQKRMEHILNQAKSVCIQCSFCTQMCPRFLIGHPLRPNRVMRRIATGAEPRELTEALLCCECGVCELYACPMLLSPRQVNIHIKNRLREQGVRSAAAEANGDYTELREYRRIAQSRLIARLQLQGYPTVIDELRVHRPGSVSVGLRHGVGRPAAPTVQPGQTVRAGDVIAAVGFDEVGCPVHAPIDGVVESVGERIVIMSGEGQA